ALLLDEDMEYGEKYEFWKSICFKN
nr:hypothetical protein [Tanacetum cinerariifolium]